LSYNPEKINGRQLFFMLFMIRATVMLSTLPVLTSADALQDSWAAAIIAYFPNVVMIFIICKLGERYPDQTAVEYSQKLLGKWAAIPVSLILVWIFMHLAAAEGRIYGEAITSDFLTETPLTFVVVTIFLTAAVAAHAGIEVIGRCADLVMPIFFVILMGSLFIALPRFPEGLSNLEPVLARGLGPPIRGSIVPFGAGIRFMTLAILIPRLNRPTKAFKNALGSFTLAMTILVYAAITVVVVLGPHKGARTVFPVFAMVRTIQVSEFLERIELFSIFAWAFGSFIGIAVFIYCASEGLRQILGLKTYRPLVGPTTLLIITLAIHIFRDQFQMRTFYQPSILGPYVLFVFAFIMGILWIAHLLRGKEG